jgi:hypothetical protein
MQIVVAALQMEGPQHSHVTDKPTTYWQTWVAATDILMSSLLSNCNFWAATRANLDLGQSQQLQPIRSDQCVYGSQRVGNTAQYRNALLLTLVVAVLADDLVVLKQGRLKGHRPSTRKGREISAFQGIPSARPPIGELRFQVRSTGVHEFPSANKH